MSNTLNFNTGKSDPVLDILLFDCVLQPNGSYKSKHGGIIWLSFESYKLANSSIVKGSITKKKTPVKKTTKKKK